MCFFLRNCGFLSDYCHYGSDETEVDWDSQKTKTEEGERLFVWSRRKLWRESQVVEATQASSAVR